MPTVTLRALCLGGPAPEAWWGDPGHQSWGVGLGPDGLCTALRVTLPFLEDEARLQPSSFHPTESAVWHVLSHRVLALPSPSPG